MPRFHNPHRGFTLVELLVVIVVIGILIGILLAALGPIRNTTQIFAITQEINQLEGAIEAFKTKFGLYPPSNLGDLTVPADLQAFKSYLRKVAPNHQETDNQIANWWAQVGRNLDNDSLLVFWLSGLNKSAQYPLTYNVGTDNTYETGDDVFTAFSVGEAPEKWVFFEFKTNRLQDPTTNAAVTTNSLLARYLQESIGEAPYVLFSSKNYAADSYTFAASGETIYPYAQSAGPPVVFYSPDKFQIVAAGLDKLFGAMPGGDWRSSPQFREQRNNITNFTQGILEKATQ